MAEQAIVGFAGVLRHLRAEAELTQQELAKAAGVSRRSVSDLERGINRTARKDTAVRLAGALGLAGRCGRCSSRRPWDASRLRRSWRPGDGGRRVGHRPPPGACMALCLR